MESLARQLNALPCHLLPETGPYQDWLRGIGCTALGDVCRLPRAGLLRRSGQHLLDSLDRAYGHAPELHEWIKAPPQFSGFVELPAKVENTESLIFAVRRLLLQLTGWLVAQQLAVSRIALLLEHERGRQAIPPMSIEIVLAEPAWHEDHLLILIKERLERTILKSPVIALRLEARHVAPMLQPTGSLFPEPGGTPADFNRLLEKLTARLGEQAVLMPAPLEDYRPEVCNQWMPAKQSRQRQNAALDSMPMPQQAERPFWMLAVPLPLMMHDFRPFYGSPLKLVSGPERIESGWWDGSLAVRDYFIAQGEEGGLYWLFRERAGQDWHWFLHGLFA
jgi:protein ImuB